MPYSARRRQSGQAAACPGGRWAPRSITGRVTTSALPHPKELVAWRGALAIGGPDAGWEDTDQYEWWDTDEPSAYQASLGSDLVVLRRFQGRTQRYTGTDLIRALSPEPRQRDVIVPPELATDFFASLDETLARTGPEGRLLEPGDEELLARYCIVLALFEEFERPGAARAYGSSPLLGVGSAPTVDGLLGIAERHWVDDLCRLSEAFFHAFDGRFSGDTVLNPTFQGVTMGADADIIIDGCLMEFKTTPHKKEWRFMKEAKVHPEQQAEPQEQEVARGGG